MITDVSAGHEAMQSAKSVYNSDCDRWIAGHEAMVIADCNL